MKNNENNANMIYITQFNWASPNKDIVTPSVDSGFATLADVEQAMGTQWVTKSNKLLLYKGLAFSTYSFGDGGMNRLRIPVTA